MLARAMNPPQRAAAHRDTPSSDAIALLPAFERLGLPQIHLVATPAQAAAARAALCGAAVLGFDTESRPTFQKGEVSDGPHIVQLATAEAAWIFQLHEPASRAAAADLLRDAAIAKVGFGLGDDKRRIIIKLGIEAQGVIDLNAEFRRRGYRREVGVKGAVAALFQKRFLKSGKAATSNWSNPRLTDAQLLYAANDAWAALRVHQALAATPA